MQKFDKIEQKTNETEGGLHLVQYIECAQAWVRTLSISQKCLISEFQNHLQTKSDLHISICQTEF